VSTRLVSLQASRPREIELLIDPALATTVLTSSDLDVVDGRFFAPDDLQDLDGPLGRLTGRRMRFVLVFQHDDGSLHLEQVEAFVVPGAPGESRLGMDVLSRWTVVLDGPGEMLVVEPAA
jgi:hypothetical protein